MSVIHFTDVLEKDLQRQVFELARLCGWRKAYHVYDSRRSQHGFPDLVLVRDRVVWLELKREKGKLTGEQREWLRSLRDASQEVYVVRPRNLDQLAAVLGSNQRGRVAQDARQDLEAQLDAELADGTR